jgi:hypothetical protein
MAWNKDHNILFGMIGINNRDMRNEEIEEQLNVRNMVEGIQQVLKTVIDLAIKGLPQSIECYSIIFLILCEDNTGQPTKLQEQ